MTGVTLRCAYCGRPIIGTPMRIGSAGDVYHAECTLPEQTAPTQWAYRQACKALDHWRAEAHRIGDLCGVKPRSMDDEA